MVFENRIRLHDVDIRNFFFDIGIIPNEILARANIPVERIISGELTGTQIVNPLIDVNITSRTGKDPANIFLVPGKNIRWKDLVTEITITEHLGGMQQGEVRMSIPLELGFAILYRAIISIMGIMVMRFGYGGQNKDIFKANWRTYIINSKPSVEFDDAFLRISFKFASILFLAKETRPGNVSIDPNDRIAAIIATAFKVGMGVEIVKGLDFSPSNKNFLLDDGLRLDSRLLEVLVRKNLVDRKYLSANLTEDEKKAIMSVMPSQSDLLQILHYVLELVGLTYREEYTDKGYIVEVFKYKDRMKEDPVVELGLRMQPRITQVSGLYRFPIINFRIPHNYFFLQRGSRMIFDKHINVVDGKSIVKNNRIEDPELFKKWKAFLDEIGTFKIKLSVEGREIITIPIPPGSFLEHSTSLNADAITKANISRYERDSDSLINIDLEVATFGMPNVFTGDVVRVVGFPANVRVRSLVNANTNQDDIGLNIGGIYIVQKLTHKIGIDEGFKTELTLLKTKVVRDRPTSEQKQVPFGSERTKEVSVLPSNGLTTPRERGFLLLR